MHVNPPTQVFLWLDQLKFSRFHTRLVMLIGLIFVFAGYNSQIIAYIVPLALKEWHLTPLKAGTMISYGFLGYVFGAAGFGMASDRLGRKKTIMLAVAVFSVFNSAAYFAHNFEVFCLLRFLSGLGIGGTIPLITTLLSEFAPSGIRARLVSATGSGFTIGWTGAGLIAAALVPHLGWRVTLLIGFLPLLFLPVLQAYLPESVRFLEGKKRYHDAIREMERIEKIAHIEPYPWRPHNFPQPDTGYKTGLRDLFRPGLRAMTLLVSGTYHLSMIAIYGLSTWLPSLLANSGFSLVKSYSFAIVQAMGATAGSFLLGYLMDAFGRKKGLCITYFLGGLSILWFGAVTSEASLYAAGAVIGIFVIGAPSALNVVLSEIYPTHVRSTGVGWAYAVGRMGSMIGPLIGGIIQMAGFSVGQFFVLFSLPCFICMILVVLYPVGVKKESLETVAVKLLK